MNLRFEDELPPLTPDQQVEAIRLAARLQADHEARSSSEALLRAAKEAGIEPRFLHEAATRVAGKRSTRVKGKPVEAWLQATLILATVDALAIFWQPTNMVGVDLSPGEFVFLVGAAFCCAFSVRKEPRVRWALPAAIFPLWLALALPWAVWHIGREGYAPSWLVPLVAIVGPSQLLAALIAAAVGAYRRPLFTSIGHNR